MRIKIYFCFLFFIFLASPLQGQESDSEKQLQKAKLLEKAYIDYQSGNLGQAVESFSKVIHLRTLSDNERATAYLLRGEAQLDLGKLEEALDDFNRAIKQSPNYAQAYFLRGSYYEKKKMLVEAWKDVSVSIELEPERENYKNHLVKLKAKMSDSGLLIHENDNFSDHEIFQRKFKSNEKIVISDNKSLVSEEQSNEKVLNSDNQSLISEEKTNEDNN